MPRDRNFLQKPDAQAFADESLCAAHPIHVLLLMEAETKGPRESLLWPHSEEVLAAGSSGNADSARWFVQQTSPAPGFRHPTNEHHTSGNRKQASGPQSLQAFSLSRPAPRHFGITSCRQLASKLGYFVESPSWEKAVLPFHQILQHPERHQPSCVFLLIFAA